MLEDGVYIIYPLNWVKLEETSNIQWYLSTRKTPLHKTIFRKECYQHLCCHICKFSTVLATNILMEDIANIICQLFQYVIQQYHSEICRHCFSVTGYHLQGLISCWCIQNSQHYMLALTVFNNISVYTYWGERLPIFMFEDGLYISCTFNLLKVEEIPNIQCWLSTSKTLLYEKILYKKYFKHWC